MPEAGPSRAQATQTANVAGSPPITSATNDRTAAAAEGQPGEVITAAPLFCEVTLAVGEEDALPAVSMVALPNEILQHVFKQACNVLLRIGCSAAASAITWALVTHIGSVASSSVVGLAAGLTLPTPHATAAFCGTFAGMSSRVVAPRITDAAVLGGAAASILAALDASNTRLLKGVGGRLGAVAALAVLVSVAATAELRAAGLLWVPSLAAAAAAPKALLPTVGATVLGSAATRLWARRLAALLLVGTTSPPVAPSADERREALALSFSNPVTSASVVGLFSSLALGPTRSRSLAAPVFAGAFVAMSAPDTLASTRAILGAAALAGFAQAGLAAVCVGGGGKLGAAAAIGVLLLRAARAAAAVVCCSGHTCVVRQRSSGPVPLPAL